MNIVCDGKEVKVEIPDGYEVADGWELGDDYEATIRVNVEYPSKRIMGSVFRIVKSKPWHEDFHVVDAADEYIFETGKYKDYSKLNDNTKKWLKVYFEEMKKEEAEAEKMKIAGIDAAWDKRDN